MKKGHESGFARIEATNLKCKVSEIIRGLDGIDGTSASLVISKRHDQLVELSYEMLHDLLCHFGVEVANSKEYFGDYIKNRIRIYASMGIISITYDPNHTEQGSEHFPGFRIACLINYSSLTKVAMIIHDISDSIVGQDKLFFIYNYVDGVISEVLSASLHKF